MQQFFPFLDQTFSKGLFDAQIFSFLLRVQSARDGAAGPWTKKIPHAFQRCYTIRLRIKESGYGISWLGKVFGMQKSSSGVVYCQSFGNPIRCTEFSPLVLPFSVTWSEAVPLIGRIGPLRILSLGSRTWKQHCSLLPLKCIWSAKNQSCPIVFLCTL